MNSKKQFDADGILVGWLHINWVGKSKREVFIPRRDEDIEQDRAAKLSNRRRRDAFYRAHWTAMTS